MIGGSHDGGMFTITSKSGLGVFMPDNLFITQSGSFLQQSCSGSRWFDVRFSKRPGTWHIFHSPGPGIPLSAYSVDASTAMNQIVTFLDDPKNTHEIIFWRIKVDSGSDTNELSAILRGTLSPYMVDNPTGNMSLPTLTLNQIWGQNITIGKLVVMAYGWVPPQVEPGKNLGWIWHYSTNQVGEYSDALTMDSMLAKCEKGQFPRLVKYKTMLNNTAHPLIGIWWTFTTQDVYSNTVNQWYSYPNALNDFYVVNQGEIGNVVLFDFFGNYPEVMEIVWDYNFNKYGSFPPHDPISGYTLLNDPPLPGTEILINPSACVNSGSAQTIWITKVIAIFVVVIVLIFLIFCVVPIVVYCCWKKKKKSSQGSYHLEDY